MLVRKNVGISFERRVADKRDVWIATCSCYFNKRVILKLLIVRTKSGCSSEKAKHQDNLTSTIARISNDQLIKILYNT